MSESVYEVAAKAKGALRRVLPKQARVRVVSGECEICGKTHKMGLGEPRCSAAQKVSHGDTEARRKAGKAIFGRALATALLLGCMSFSGCALAPKVDANYRTRVDSFSCPVGVVWTGSILTVGVAPTWHYRQPAASAITPLQHTTK